jgi:hypothetical protein
MESKPPRSPSGRSLPTGRPPGEEPDRRRDSHGRVKSACDLVRSKPSSSVVSGVVDVMDSIVPDGSPAFIGSHNQPGDEPL